MTTEEMVEAVLWGVEFFDVNDFSDIFVDAIRAGKFGNYKIVMVPKEMFPAKYDFKLSKFLAKELEQEISKVYEEFYPDDCNPNIDELYELITKRVINFLIEEGVKL